MGQCDGEVKGRPFAEPELRPCSLDWEEFTDGLTFTGALRASPQPDYLPLRTDRKRASAIFKPQPGRETDNVKDERSTKRL